MTKREMFDVLKALLQALDDAERPKPQPPRAQPPPRSLPPPQSTGWVMDAFGCPMPEHEEAIEFSQPIIAMDLVDVASYIKRAAPATPQDRDVDITRAVSRDATAHIDLTDSRSWHP